MQSPSAHSELQRPAVSYGRYTALSCLSIVVVWWAAAAIVQSDILPGPLAVASWMINEAKNGELFFHLSMTLWRVAAAYTLALVIGSAIGMAMGQWRLTDRIFDPWLILLLNVPALVVIILAYIWIGLTEVAAIVAVAINKIPNVVVTLREGTRTLDPDLDDVARVYRMPPLKKLRYVVLPQLQPYFAAASRSGLSLIWKIVLVVELLGRSNGVGFQLHLHFQLFNVTAILAYTLAFVLVVLLLELFLIQPLERHTSRWRKSNA